MMRAIRSCIRDMIAISFEPGSCASSSTAIFSWRYPSSSSMISLPNRCCPHLLAVLQKDDVRILPLVQRHDQRRRKLRRVALLAGRRRVLHIHRVAVGGHFLDLVRPDRLATLDDGCNHLLVEGVL